MSVADRFGRERSRRRRRSPSSTRSRSRSGSRPGHGRSTYRHGISRSRTPHHMSSYCREKKGFYHEMSVKNEQNERESALSPDYDDHDLEEVEESQC